MGQTVKQIIDGIIEREKGYVNNPKDRGGPTRWGVTEKEARANGYTGDMRDLPRTFAYEILLHKYHIKPRFNEVTRHSLRTGIAVTDAGVLCGQLRAATWLQVALNALNREQTLYHDVAEDGDVGPRTLAALRAYLNYRGADGELVLLRALNCQLGAHFISITRAREANEEFIYGWLLHRVNVE